MPEKPHSLEEYKMLREDIKQRIGFRFQLFNLLLAALGLILPYGLREKMPEILLVYPILSFFLALNWMHQGSVIVKLARYIREELEPNIPGMGWEAYIKTHSEKFSGFSRAGIIATSGFLLFSQWLTCALALAGIEAWTPAKIILAVAAGLLCLSTIVALVIFSRMKR